MYKVIVAFITGFLVLAFGMRLCNSDESEKYEGVQPDHIEYQEELHRSKQDSFDSEIDFNSNQDSRLPVMDHYLDLEFPCLTKNVPEQILIRKSYSVSYNCNTKCPNWVAWHLSSDHTDGPISRRGIPYTADNDIKGPRQEVDDWDSIKYIRIWDHGHMCPAGDNKWDRTAMEQTFLLSNFCPQNQQLNGGDWRILEEKCRLWANKYKDVYIACGPIYYDSMNVKKLKNKIWIPDAFFKVILRLNKLPMAIGFIYPNEANHHSLEYYAVSVDSVENITGIDFFYNLPDSLENNLEASFDFVLWN